MKSTTGLAILLFVLGLVSVVAAFAGFDPVPLSRHIFGATEANITGDAIHFLAFLVFGGLCFVAGAILLRRN